MYFTIVDQTNDQVNTYTSKQASGNQSHQTNKPTNKPNEQTNNIANKSDTTTLKYQVRKTSKWGWVTASEKFGKPRKVV